MNAATAWSTWRAIGSRLVMFLGLLLLACMSQPQSDTMTNPHPASHSRREGEALLEGDEIGPVRLQDGAFGVEIDLVDEDVLELALHRLVVGKEAAADPVGDLTEPQVDAGGLEVLVRDGEAAAADDVARDGVGQVLDGKDALPPRRQLERTRPVTRQVGHTSS